MSEAKETTSKSKLSGDLKKSLDHKSTYQLDGKTFIVTPIFRQEGSDTLGTALVKLMQSELHYER